MSLKTLLLNSLVSSNVQSSNGDFVGVVLFLLGVLAFLCVILFLNRGKDEDREEKESDMIEEKQANSTGEPVKEERTKENVIDSGKEEKSQSNGAGLKQAENTEVASEKSHGCAIWLLLIVGAIIFGVIFVNNVTKNKEKMKSQNGSSVSIGGNTDGVMKLLSRSARDSDISYNFSDELSLGITYKIVPDTDIKDLQVTIYCSDKNDSLITSKTKAVGNVKAGVEYSVTISISEFTFSEMFKIEYYRLRVTGGTVSYFG